MRNTIPKINTLIIGAGRSGTTTLYEYLKNHHDICFSDFKEVYFFSFDDIYKKGTDYLTKFFKNYKNEKIVITADTYLLIDEDGPARVAKYNPGMKIIVALREPVSRAYSSFIYSKNFGYDKRNLSFYEAYEKESEVIKGKDIIIKNNLGHFYSSLYYKHLSNWLKFFPRKNFFIYKMSDLSNNPIECLNKLYAFLEIELIKDLPDKIHVNKAAGAKNKYLQIFLLNRNHPIRRFIRFIFPEKIRNFIISSGMIEIMQKLNLKNTKYNSLEQEEIDKYTDYFKEDLENLKKEFGISFND